MRLSEFHKCSLIVFALLMASIAISAMPGVVSAGIDPAHDTYVWDGEGVDALASTAANWYKVAVGGAITDDVAPTADSNLVWNGTSTKACTFNIDDGTAVFYSFNMNAGYSGTITQANTADIRVGTGGVTLGAGTLTGDTGKDLICAGSFTQTSACTITTNKLTVVMNGDGTSLNTNASTAFYDLSITANVTLTHGANFVSISHNLNVAIGKTLSIPTGKSLSLLSYNGATLTNSGTISGLGTLQVRTKAENPTITFGAVNTPVQIYEMSNTGGNGLVKPGANTVLGSTLSITSSHATYTVTFDLNGKDLTATGITTGTRAIFLGGEGDITTTSWDSSAGTWTPETSNITFTGTGTIKTAAGQTFYNLTVGASASVTQSSNIVVSEWMELDGGAWTKGAYTLTAPLMTISSTITATGTEDTAYSYIPTADQPITSVSVVTNGTWLSIIGTSVVGTPTNAEVGTFYVNVTCTNVIGSVSQNSTITISNAAPVWLTAGYSTEWSYGMTYSYDPSASDEGAGLTYSMTTSAIELRCDPASGIVRGKVLDNSITVSLMADDGNGAVIWQNWTITAMGFSWDGDILVNYTEGQNLKVTFNASLTNATYNAIIKSVQWNFGDGNGSRVLDLAPMHPYERAGTYTVTCYIVTEDDMTATKNFQITVGDPAVVEDLENQYAERVNQAVLISGLACAAGLVLIACYIKIAGRRGWINRLVPVMILVAMLAISATLIGSAMQ